MYFDSAMVEWNRENGKFILIRNYQQVIELANSSVQCSEQAIERAKKNRLKIESFLEVRINVLGKRILDFEEKLGNFPMDEGHRKEMAKSKLYYSEGVLAYKNRNFASCQLKLDSVEMALNTVYALYEDMYVSYLNEYPSWHEMLGKTLAASKRNNSSVIIIDKLARELIIYKNGLPKQRFEIELGANWVGDKKQQGDKATPEGMYKVIAKKQNGQTKYYKAFLLNYPNEEDKRRFALNKKQGLINQDAKIGNLIEIHGSGGKGLDWTDGCVALKDSDMDALAGLCPVGTLVTIVGSSKPLSELSSVLP